MKWRIDNVGRMDMVEFVLAISEAVRRGEPYGGCVLVRNRPGRGAYAIVGGEEHGEFDADGAESIFIDNVSEELLWESGGAEWSGA